MRVFGAKNFGGGRLLSAFRSDGEDRIYVLENGIATERSASGSRAVGGFTAYCRAGGGVVTLEGGVPHYDDI